VTYMVKERFRTVQGEGHHTGTPAIFIRFAGCNMWSGREEDRARDARRNLAQCPNWCDTDFVGGTKMSARDIGTWLEAEHVTPLIVLTGGEPMLQVDDELIQVIHDAAPESRIAIETNGTVKPMFWYENRKGCPSWFWVTMSPKRAREETVLPWAHELKLVWPAYEPHRWTDFDAEHFYIQPQADREVRDEHNEHEAALVVADGFRWKLSLQGHKITRMR
jgi:7-carboxy-7-deazaguanine synthase